MPSALDIVLAIERDAGVQTTARQLHAAVVGALSQPGDVEDDAAKPFSVWPLMVPDSHENGLLLRVGWLPDVPPPASILELGRRWRFGSLDARSTSVGAEYRPYRELATHAPAASVRLDFHSPTSFSRSGSVYPLPDPFLVFRNLANRWDVEAGDFAIGDEAVAAFLRDLEVVDFSVAAQLSLMDRVVRGRGVAPVDSHRVGFTGHLTVRPAKRAPRETGVILGALARFAEFAGVGAMTTRGLGACTADIEEAA